MPRSPTAAMTPRGQRSFRREVGAFELGSVSLGSMIGAAYPLAGGTARWPRLAFGSLGGFTAGWMAWLQAVTIVPIEVEAALGYLNHQWPGLLNTAGALTTTGLGTAVALMLLFTVINILEVRWLRPPRPPRCVCGAAPGSHLRTAGPLSKQRKWRPRHATHNARFPAL